MAETCETQDTLISNSCICSQGYTWQSLGPPKCLLCPATYFAEDRDTLIEQSNILLKQSVAM